MGDELDKLSHHLEMEAKRERPLSADDAFGAPSGKRYEREVARRAWEYINHHLDRSRPLPDWVADYLQMVARRVQENLGPQGGLSREAADLAIGIDGKAWAKHIPEAVYLTIQAWRDKGEVSGPKEGATRYVRKVMKDETVPNSRVIDLYKRGKRSVEKECAEIDAWWHPEDEVALDRMVTNHPPFILKWFRRRRSDGSN
jgi:hypothetical protein